MSMCSCLTLESLTHRQIVVYQLYFCKGMIASFMLLSLCTELFSQIELFCQGFCMLEGKVLFSTFYLCSGILKLRIDCDLSLEKVKCRPGQELD